MIQNSNMVWLLDGIVVLMIAVPALIGYYKGFVYACLGFLPIIVSFFGSKILSPIFSKFLRKTELFDFFKKN